MNLLTRPELASDTQAHEDHHEHDHGHEQGGMKVFGMWVYLMSDLVLFGSCSPRTRCSAPPTPGPTGKDLFSLPFVMAETFLLLVSSITYGQAVLACIATMLGGAALAGRDFRARCLVHRHGDHEFSHLIHEGAARAPVPPVGVLRAGRHPRPARGQRPDLDGGGHAPGSPPWPDPDQHHPRVVPEPVLALPGPGVDLRLHLRLPDRSLLTWPTSKPRAPAMRTAPPSPT